MIKIFDKDIVKLEDLIIFAVRFRPKLGVLPWSRQGAEE
jgi:hypothetical protein